MSFAYELSKANMNTTLFPKISNCTSICFDLAIKLITIDKTSVEQLNSVLTFGKIQSI